MFQSLLWFWTLMIFASIAWYGLLLFYVGFQGGREILQLAKTLTSRDGESSKLDGLKPK